MVRRFINALAMVAAVLLEYADPPIRETRKAMGPIRPGPGTPHKRRDPQEQKGPAAR